MSCTTNRRWSLFSFQLLYLLTLLALAIGQVAGEVVVEYVHAVGQRKDQSLHSQIHFMQQPTVNDKKDCPDTSGGPYVTKNGVFYAVQCEHHYWTTTLSTTTAASLSDCMDKCSLDPLCKAVNYHLIENDDCSLMGDASKPTDSTKCVNHHYAYQVDPPTIVGKDEELVACSTSCPTCKHSSSQNECKN